MTPDSLRSIIKADIQRYTGCNGVGIGSLLKTCYENEALCLLILFRICQKIIGLRNVILRLFLKLIFVWTTYKFFSVLVGISIELKAKIGKGLYIGHYGEIFIGPIEMGRCCNISQGVTIGLGRLGTEREGLPKVGDRVFFGPGAKVFGHINIGNNVSIGANAVVSKDIPDNAIVVGNPGKIVGSQEKNIHIQNPIEE